MTAQSRNLLNPGQIGQMTLKNRMVVTAMGTNLAEEGGYCGETLMAYHERQAEGGVGLIVLGVTGVAWPQGGNLPRQVAISDDRFIPGLAELAERVHRHGARIAAQLHHGGLVAVQDTAEGRPLWVPSYPEIKSGDFLDGFLESEMTAMFDPNAPQPSLRPMSQQDIAQLVDWFADGAMRARRAGLDGVEIHAGHGYIISEFLSPLTNTRTDAYGGSLENRARLLLEILAAIRAKVGRDFPVWCKLDFAEFGCDEGISLADAVATAKLAESAGADAITVTAYHDASQGWLHSESNIPHTPERMVAGATAIKSALDIPVICSGRIEPDSADKHIARGNFDFLGMGRKLLADPGLPNKLAAGRADQVRPCIYCYCCVSQIYMLKQVKCAVNPELGRERDYQLVASDRPRHIAVVGGGPAGMEAARRLSLRGYRVTLLEKTKQLGGALQLASIAYEPNERLLRWLRHAVAESSVAVRLGVNANAALLRQLGVDEVIVASGAVRNMPEIPGADRDFVFSGDDMRALVLADPQVGVTRKTSATARLLTRLGSLTGLSRHPGAVRIASRLWLPLGKRVVIIGAELVGLELAEFLAERHYQVTVVDAGNKPGAGLYLVRRLRLLAELRGMGVSLLNRARDIGIEEAAVGYTNYRGQRRSLAADTVIVAQGAAGDTTLAQELESEGFTTHVIGDCTGVGYIEGAMESAADIARRI